MKGLVYETSVLDPDEVSAATVAPRVGTLNAERIDVSISLYKLIETDESASLMLFSMIFS